MPLPYFSFFPMYNRIRMKKIRTIFNVNMDNRLEEKSSDNKLKMSTMSD